MNKLKKSMGSALAVAVAMAAFAASAVETIELLDVHLGGSNRDTLYYTYRTSKLTPSKSYNLEALVRAWTKGSSGRVEKVAYVTNTLSTVNGDATGSINLVSKFGSGTYVDCEVLLSLIGVIDDVPVGTVFDFAGDLVPSGYLACDGSPVSRTTYAKLFGAIGTLYGSGNGKDTFNLPNFSNAFAEGTSDSSQVGKSRSAGVPDVKGRRYWLMKDGGSSFYDEGVFYDVAQGTSRAWEGNGDWREVYDIKFLASKGELHGDDYRNDVYGKSDTVQPKSVVVLKIIKY